jgi:putative sterol carrier protein
MTYEELVKKVETAYAKADASAVDEHVAVQFNITGEGEGAFYLEVAEGKIDIQPYEYLDRDAIVWSGADVLVDIAAGKVGITEAYSKGLLSVDGNLAKAALLEKIVLKKAPAKKAAAAKKEAAPKTETKKTAKKAETKKEEAPKAAAKKEEAPKAEAKKAEAPKAEVKKAEAKKAPAKKAGKAAK